MAGTILSSCLRRSNACGGRRPLLYLSPGLRHGRLKRDELRISLPGVHFILTDAAGTKVNEGDTDKDGKVLFASLLLGTYILKETSAPAGYELDDTPMQISLTRNGDLITKTITNSHSTGSVSILKTDSSTGAALAGAHFKLTDASGSLLKEGDTGSDGTLTFTGIPIGTYYLAESAAPSGYVLDSTPVTVEITTGGQTVSKTFVNAPAVGSIVITKTDSATGATLPGVHFKLADANGSTVKEGDTDSNGTLSFTDNCFVTASFNTTEKVWYIVGHAAEATSATRFVPDASGKLIIKGLEDDAYSITEVTTSNGYSLLKNSVKLVIADTEAAAACGIYSTDALGLIQNDPRYAGVNPGLYKNMPQKHLEHKPLTAAATVDGNPVNMKPDSESGNAFVPFVCVNTKGFDLPQTGGHGSYWFPIIGLSGLALAVFGIVLLSRKKTAKDN